MEIVKTEIFHGHVIDREGNIAYKFEKRCCLCNLCFYKITVLDYRNQETAEEPKKPIGFQSLPTVLIKTGK